MHSKFVMAHRGGERGFTEEGKVQAHPGVNGVKMKDNFLPGATSLL